MPQLEWNDNDFALCLEVMPEVDEHRVEYIYTVKKDGLVLTVTVWQYESVIGLSLRAPGVDAPAMEFALYVRGPATYMDEKWGEYLRLSDCVIAPSNFHHFEQVEVDAREEAVYRDTDHLYTPKSRYGFTVSVAVQPHIRIRRDPF